MKKGITFMSLVIMIAIILTLTTTAVISGVNSVNNTKKIKYATELSFVTELINSYVDVNYEFDFSKTFVIDLSGVSDDVKMQFNNETIVDNKLALYEIDLSSDILKNYDLTYGKKTIGDSDEEKQKDVFLYSITSKKVYYAKGLELNGRIYYTLTDELRNKIDYSYDFEKSNMSSSIFYTQSTYDWTNTSVSCEIKIPKSIYRLTDFRVYKDATVVNTSQETTSYYVYNIVADANCNIKVTDYGGQIIIKSYDITNIDKVSPVLTVTDITKIFDPDTHELKRSLQISEKYDNESGIKAIKYENTKLPLSSVKSYFMDNGINLKEDSIVLGTDVQNVTIYIEDNAGNYSAIIK